MEIKIQTGEELNRLLDALATEIVEANSYFRLFCGLVNCRPAHEREFLQSEVFWCLTQSALRGAFLINLCRVYDQNSKSLNLVNLLDTIRVNLHFFSETNFRERLKGNAFVDCLAQTNRTPKMDELKCDIETVSCQNIAVKKLTIWRGNIVAHHNAKLALGKNQSLEENSLSEMEIQQLLEHSLTIFNKYSSLYRASTQSPIFIMGQDDYKSLLKFIGLGLKKWDEDTAKPFNFAGLV